MKVMIVTPYFAPKIGGLENYALNIAKGLQKKGDDVFVVTTNHLSKEYVEETIEGLRVVRLPIDLKLSNTPFGLKWYFQLKKIVKEEKPDIINAHCPVPYIADMAAMARGKTRFVLTYHNDLVKAQGLGKYLAKVFYFLFINRTLKNSDAIIATSEYYANNSHYLKKYKDKVCIVSPGIDSTVFSTASSKKSTIGKRSSDRKTLIFAGNLDLTHAHKGLDVLIETMAHVRKEVQGTELIVIGKGDGIPKYEALAKTKGVSDIVTFTGFLPDQEYAKKLRSSDVFVMPSTTDAEGFGMVALEASASGVPVVASRVGGVPAIVKDGYNGLLVAPGNAIELCKAIVSLLKSEKKRKSFSDNGILLAKEYLWDIKVDETKSSFLQVLKPRVCIIHNIISPYRLPIFEGVSKTSNLTVLFCRPITKDRKWKFDLTQFTFKFEVLKGFEAGPLIINYNALKALKRTRFDVIIANNDPDVAVTALTGLLMAKLQQKRILDWSQVVDKNVHFFPAVAYATKPPMTFVRTVLGAMILAYRKLCISMADHHVVLSKQAGKYLESLNVSGSKITHMPQVMPPYLLPEPNAIGNRTGKKVLYVGYLNERKGVRYLIEGFKEVKDQDAELIIAGSGPTADDLKTRASDDKRIKFIGYIEGVEKANLYASCDIFVLPTLNDVWGLVVNEAMHYGLAMVCSTAAVAREIVDSDSGTLVAPRSSSDIRDAIDFLITNQEKLKNIQKNNFTDTKKQDLNITISKLQYAIDVTARKQ